MTTTRHPYRWITLTALAMILAAEVTLRLAGPRLPEPIDWYDDVTQLKVEQMDDRRAAGTGTDVLFAGTSMTLRLDPAVFDANDPLGRTSYNGALPAAVPTVMERWITEEAAPRLDPGLVLYGLSSLDLNDSRASDPTATYNQARATRRGFWADLERLAADHSMIVHYRPMFRTPGKLRQTASAFVDGDETEDDEIAGPTGEVITAASPFSEATQIAATRRALNDYTVSGEQLEAIRATFTALRREGIDLVLVDMPVPQRYIDQHPDGLADYELAQAAIRGLAAELGVPVIDLATDFHDDDLFIDYTHLSPEGSRIATAALAEKLAALDAPDRGGE